jgi:ABC-type glycerol-3-phosphate transport system permease component
VRRHLPEVVARLGAVLLVAFVAVPLWVVVVLSLDPVAGGGDSVGLWPRRVSLDNYRFLTSPVYGFYNALSHSLIVSAATTVVSLLVAIPAAYALGRLRVPGQARILAVLIGLAFFPGVVIELPLGILFAENGLLDTLVGVATAQLSFTVPLAVWFLAYAFRAVPREVEEAALMDGAGVVARITRVILPMARAGLAGTTVLVFVASWNDFVFSGNLNRSRRSETLPVMISKLPDIGFLGGQMAAAVLISLPVILVVAVLLRWLAGRGDRRGMA